MVFGFALITAFDIYKAQRLLSFKVYSYKLYIKTAEAEVM